jgi:hypothetical protein
MLNTQRNAQLNLANTRINIMALLIALTWFSLSAVTDSNRRFQEASAQVGVTKQRVLALDLIMATVSATFAIITASRDQQPMSLDALAIKGLGCFVATMGFGTNMILKKLVNASMSIKHTSPEIILSSIIITTFMETLPSFILGLCIGDLIAPKARQATPTQALIMRNTARYANQPMRNDGAAPPGPGVG